MLKWEEEADDPSSGRWIILIAYIMGLGLGVHRLNLLVIPVLVIVFYFRKYEFTAKGFIKTLLLAILLLWLLVFVLIPGVPKIAEWFELLFVNVFGLPYNTGLFIFVITVTGLLVAAIRFTHKRRKVVLNYAITSLAVIMIGYSSYAMIMIRSSAKPPMNQNNPSDVFSLSYYINMQQYGSSPKFFGPYYSAQVVDVKRKIAGYNKIDGKYVPYYRPEYEFNKEFTTVFPRLYSQEPEHIESYKHWGKIKGRKYTVGSGADKETIVVPTFGENLRFFFRYQTGFMYFRYLMWNFAGRQNDIQGNGNNIHGNWISGIKFIDEARLGDLDSLPQDLKNNPARNTYFLLPLLAGILGILWQYKKDKKGLILVLSFFIMTGLAIILYLNQNPNQPRERDYAYAGSFYAFAIWIGMGFMYLYEQFIKLLNARLAGIIAFLLLLAGVPVLMASQNWDDHDRSGRYTARDIGANYLESCAPNAIIFTYGDNDSFPLWYVQDVEGIRTDVRVANLSYIQAGWYIDMMRQKAFESDPLPLSLPEGKYMDGIRTQLPVNNRVDRPVNIRDIVQFAGQDDKKFMIDYSGRGDYLNYLPANKFIIDVDSSVVLSNGTVKEYFRDRLLSPLVWEFTDEDAFKGDLAIMDLLGTNEWNRPVYISTTVPSTQYKGLDKFFIQEGMAYRIAPVKTDKNEQGEYGIIDPEVMYDNMMNKFKWGNASDPDVYLDENNRRMFGNFKRLFGTLGDALLQKGDSVRAVAAARKGLELVPASKVPDDYFSIEPAGILIRTGHIDEGLKIIENIIAYSKEYLEYAISLRGNESYSMGIATGINMQALLDIYNMAVSFKMDPLAGEVENLINLYYPKLYSR
jgi:hypothetical protein